MCKLLMYLPLAILVYQSVADKGRSEEDDSTTFCDGSDRKCCETKCPDGWFGFGGHCYYFQYTKRTWQQAKFDCEKKGGHLATVNSEKDNGWLKMNMASSSGVCRDPNAILFDNNGVKTCFWTSPTPGTFMEGTKYCKSIGGRVADVHDQTTNDYVISHFRTEAYFGMYLAVWYDEGNDKYIDSEGHEQTFIDWGPNEPQKGIERCLSLKKFKWIDLPCTWNHHILCSHNIADIQPFWIGATDKYSEGTFKWSSTNTDIEFEDFKPGEPSGQVQENCVMFKPETGLSNWDDAPCSDEIWSICQKDADCED